MGSAQPQGGLGSLAQPGCGVEALAHRAAGAAKAQLHQTARGLAGAQQSELALSRPSRGPAGLWGLSGGHHARP